QPVTSMRAPSRSSGARPAPTAAIRPFSTTTCPAVCSVRAASIVTTVAPSRIVRSGATVGPVAEWVEQHRDVVVLVRVGDREHHHDFRIDGLTPGGGELAAGFKAKRVVACPEPVRPDRADAAVGVGD